MELLLLIGGIFAAIDASPTEPISEWLLHNWPLILGVVAIIAGYIDIRVQLALLRLGQEHQKEGFRSVVGAVNDLEKRMDGIYEVRTRSEAREGL